MSDKFYKFSLVIILLIITISCESTLTPKYKINRMRVLAIQTDPAEFVATEDDVKNPSYPSHTTLRALTVDPNDLDGLKIKYHWESVIPEFSDFVHSESTLLFLDFHQDDNNSMSPFNPVNSDDIAKKNLAALPKNTTVQIPVKLQIRDENNQVAEEAIKSLYLTFIDKGQTPSQKRCSVALNELSVERVDLNSNTSTATNFHQATDYSLASLRAPDLLSDSIQKNARYKLSVKKFFHYWNWDKNDPSCQNADEDVKIEWYATHGKFETSRNRFEKIWIASDEETDSESDTVQLILVMRDKYGASDWWRLYGTFEK